MLLVVYEEEIRGGRTRDKSMEGVNKGEGGRLGKGSE